MNPSSTVIYICVSCTNTAKIMVLTIRVKNGKIKLEINYILVMKEDTMKKTIIRLICLTLVAVMMFFAVGCDALFDLSLLEDPTWDTPDVDGELPNSEKEYTKKNNEEPSFVGYIPPSPLDFEEKEVAILYRHHIQNSREWYKAILEDELDEAVADRNNRVEDQLNITIVWEPVATNSDKYSEYSNKLYDMVKNDVDSGLHEFDISANFAYASTATVIRDYAANLLDEAVFPYFDFSLPCWNQSIVNDTTFNDQLFYVCGDINLSMFDAACVVWHNKTLYDEKKDPTIDPNNIQQLALDGGWTYEKLYRWTSVFYENSNGKDSGRDSGDTYALMAAQSYGDNMPSDAIPYAWELDFVTTNDDGTHSFNIVDNQKVEDALSKYRNLLHGTGTYNSSDIKLFAEGNSIFYMGRMYEGHDSNMAMREMEDRYALLPMPKYDVNQEQYATTSEEYYTLMFVLDHSDSKGTVNGDAVSAFLQLATEESYTGVRGSYFNCVVKPKFFQTDDSEGTVTRSAALFDIIVANIKLDYACVYSQQLNKINRLWRSACQPGVNDALEKLYNSQSEDFEKAIMETDAWLGLMEIE